MTNNQFESLKNELIHIGIKFNNAVKHIPEFYPELDKFNAIKRLIAISSEWDKMFERATMDGGK